MMFSGCNSDQIQRVKKMLTKSAVNISLGKQRGIEDSNYRRSNLEGTEATEYHAVEDVT